MSASSARRTMLFSSSPVASIMIDVLVGLCMTAAPSLGLGSILDPSVYNQSSGLHSGVHGTGEGGSEFVVVLWGRGGVGRGSRFGGG